LGHALENTVEEGVNLGDLCVCDISFVPVGAVEDDSEGCGDLASCSCGGEVDGVHLHVHAHVINGVFTACMPVELFGREGGRRSQCRPLGRLESLLHSTHVNFVGRFFVRAACSRAGHVCVGRSECLVIGRIIRGIGRQVDRRLSVFAALINRNWVGNSHCQ